MEEPLLPKDSNVSYSGATLWSKLTFSWLSPLLQLGYTRHLTSSDVPPLGEDDSAEVLYDQLKTELNISSTGSGGGATSKSKLVLALLRCHWRLVLITGALAFIRTISISLGPVFLYLFVDLTASSLPWKTKKLYGLLLVLGLTFVKAAQSISHRHWSFHSRRLGVKVRASIVAAVYDKSLRLSNRAKQRHSGGEIVSYVGVDSYRLGEFPWWLHYSWATLLQLVLALIIIFTTVTYAGFACILVLLITLLVQIPVSRALQVYQSKFMTAQDTRLRRTTEVLTSMKIIKLQAWEEEFKSMIDERREEELHWLGRMLGKRNEIGIIFWLSYASAVSFTLLAYVLLGNELTAAVIFTVFSAFSNTQEPVRVVPDVLATLSQVMVSLHRLEVFLNDDEFREGGGGGDGPSESDTVVRIHGPASFAWEEHKTLSGIVLEVQRGDKVAVCGSVGAGKSSLLCAILGEIPRTSGAVHVDGRVAYVSQVAWIQSGTIRDNILFGKGMEEERYRSVIRACALERDLELFSYGDMTEIGERGLNLSGGQKQRIQLARAVYNDADIYLLDDPFSAVDAHTAATLFHECVMKSLEQKTVILVTHQVEFLPTMDRVVVMEGGEIQQLGKYEELMRTGLGLEKLVNAHHNTLNTALTGSKSITRVDSTNRESITTDSPDQQSADTQGVGSQLTEDEEKEVGNLGLQPYKDYLDVSRGHFLLFLDLLLQAGLVAGQVTGALWLAIQVMKPEMDSHYVAYGYMIIAYVTSLFLIARVFVHLALGLRASRAFSSGLMSSLFKAPMSFFDSTPTGRILSRASTDLNLIDVDVFTVGHILIAFIFDFPGVMVVLGLVLWPALIVVFPMLWVILMIESYYRASAQELMRINAMTKAPILNFSGESISGAMTIRAFKVTQRFKDKNARLINTDSAIYFYTNAAIEWLILRVETCGGVLLLAFGLGLNSLPDIQSGLAGVGLAYSLTINVSLVLLSQWYCQMASHIISVERIKQYMSIPAEPPAVVESNRPPPEWPSKGEIVFDNLQIKYRPDMPLVLRGISCRVAGGSKVGVVGRTGSGKSTLISAIFRLVEPAGGKIVIDGIDICSIGLRDLRFKLGIIPQEPTLFRGTVRTNLDPLGKYSDEEIWETLDKCQMGKEIRAMSSQLDSSVTDEGGNWSAGQRQLFCLGRVLLKRTRVLVLDEATASIDSSTDAILQRVIRDEFCACTVITVAHRIPTVIDSDMVLTLQDGLLAEYQPPLVLLQDKKSLFAKLVAEYWAQRSHNQS